MSDTIYYFLILMTVSVCVVIAFISRVLAKRRHPEKKETENVERSNAIDKETNRTIDPVNNPALDDGEFNIFYDDHEK